MASLVSSTFVTIPIATFYDVKNKLFNDMNMLKSSEELNEQVANISAVINTYLSEIIPDIENEIKNIVKFNSINWRERKNPKLLEKFVNTDANIAIFNREINKISATNYSQMMHNINNIIMDDENVDKIDEYIRYVFHHIFQKCLNEELFSVDYIKFIVSFTEPVATKLKTIIYENIVNILKLVETTNINDTVIDAVYDGPYVTATNISPRVKTYGMILGHYFNNMESIRKTGIFTDEIVISSIVNFIRNIKSGKYYNNSICKLNAVLLLLGFCDSGLDKYCKLIMADSDENIYTSFEERDNVIQELINTLDIIGRNMEIPSKIRFKALDIKDNILKMDIISNTAIDNPSYHTNLSTSNNISNLDTTNSITNHNSGHKNTYSKNYGYNNSTTTYKQYNSTYSSNNEFINRAKSNDRSSERHMSNQPYEPSIKIGGKQLMNFNRSNNTSNNTSSNTYNKSVRNNIFAANNNSNDQKSDFVSNSNDNSTNKHSHKRSNINVWGDNKQNYPDINSNNSNNSNNSINNNNSNNSNINAKNKNQVNNNSIDEWNTVPVSPKSVSTSNGSSLTNTPPLTPTEDKKSVIDYVAINDISDMIDDDLDYTIICRKKKTQTSPKNLSKRNTKY